jgi:hypothetical protein
MNAKQMCVANVQYKKPTANDAKRQQGLLRYLTYRDGRDGHIQQEAGMGRWVDHGLGGSVRDIATRCDALKSDHVLAFTLVFNANPELLAMVPHAQREAFVKDLTETSLQRFFEARGIEGGIEFSYVLHHRESENPQSPGLHDPHTHVILPGSFFEEGAGERAPLYFSRNKQVNHIELLHRTTEQTLRDLLDRELGRDWEQRFDQLEALREQQRAITKALPHGQLLDERGRAWDTWIGERRTDDGQTAVGYYRYYPRDSRSEQTNFKPEELELEFRPLASHLPHDQAATLAAYMGRSQWEHPEQSLADTLELITDLGALSDPERTFYVQDMAEQLAALRAPELTRDRTLEDVPQERGHDLDFF